MKWILLLTISFSLFFLSSCSSEYSERLLKAKELNLEIQKTLKHSHELGAVAWQQIEDLQKEILYHAKISGNEALFIEELNN